MENRMNDYTHAVLLLTLHRKLGAHMRDLRTIPIRLSKHAQSLIEEQRKECEIELRAIRNRNPHAYYIATILEGNDPL
jgi:hypothetical protein